jgi:hypothetical protein
MLKRSAKLLSDKPKPLYPRNLFIPSKPGEKVTDKWLETKYPDFIYNNHWYSRSKWGGQRHFEKNAMRAWYAKIKDGNGEGSELNRILKWLRRIDVLIFVLLSILIVPWMYILVFMKTDFQKKHQWFVNTWMVQRGAPYVLKPWDKVKKGDDGHYYIGKDRID